MIYAFHPRTLCTVDLAAHGTPLMGVWNAELTLLPPHASYCLIAHILVFFKALTSGRLVLIIKLLHVNFTGRISSTRRLSTRRLDLSRMTELTSPLDE